MTVSQDIILKRSSVSDASPTISQLEYGELALNYADGKIHYRNSNDEIIPFLDEPGVRALGDIGHAFHVSQNGDDANSGKTWANAFATIEKALEACWGVYNSSPTRGGEITLIDIGPGVYETEGHLDMPDNCVIRGVYRTVNIRPKNIQITETDGIYAGQTVWCKNRNVFRLGSGCFIEGLLFEDFVIDDMNNPSEGFAASFRPNAVIYRTPYVHKIAVRNTPSWASIGVAPPLDREASPVPNPLVGLGGGVVLADGAVCSPFSIYPNIMTWGATPVVHNGISYCAKRGGLVNAVNAISLWAHKHFLALDGGQIILSACTCQFGDYTLVAEGFGHTVNPYMLEELTPPQAPIKFANTATYITDAVANTIIDDLWTDIVTNPTDYPGITSDEEYLTKRDAKSFIQCMKWVMQSGVEKPMLDFAKGFFKPDPDQVVTDYISNTIPVLTETEKTAFLNSYTFMGDKLKIAMLNEADDLIDGLVTALSRTIAGESPYPTRFVHQPSTITAIGHTWSVVMAGVALTHVPPGRNQTTIQDSILELNNGVVYASGQDDQGSAIFIGGLKIDSDTGELTGPPFDTSVNRIATRTAIARSF